MDILFAAAEIAPLIKVGGLGDVVRSLPKELIKAGHDVRVIAPRYGFTDLRGYATDLLISSLPILALGEYRLVNLEYLQVEGIPVYLIGNDIFLQSNMVYGENEIEKFFIYCTVVSEVLPRLGWQPDIVHCHDWHAALIPLMLRRRGCLYSTVYTIHNIKYQGYFERSVLYQSDLAGCWNARLFTGEQIPLNFMSQGILWADAINTVSENFAREILTVEHGCGMQGLLNFRKDKFCGIRNGLGYEEYDPRKDKFIAASYTYNTVEHKEINKKALQRRANWPENATIPLIGMVTRMDEQKGLDILLQVLPQFAESTQVQFVFLGKGKDYYENALQELAGKYPDKIRAYIEYDDELAHLVYAGSDIFLMPSRWEPCGLSQLIAMRYGTVPVVHATGGLIDTVQNLNTEMSQGTGFVFEVYDAKALQMTLGRAVECFAHKDAWCAVMKRIMQQDFTWREPVKKYERLYNKVLEYGRGRK